jgi:hypothetical protein
MMIGEGDVTKADYVIDANIAEYWYRIERHQHYVKQRNAAMKPKSGT